MTETRDLVYREKRRGPSTDPWGTPVRGVWGEESNPFQETWKVRSVRYEENHFRAVPVMPRSARVSRSSWWFTVSNAADRSRRLQSGRQSGQYVALLCTSARSAVLHSTLMRQSAKWGELAL